MNFHQVMHRTRIILVSINNRTKFGNKLRCSTMGPIMGFFPDLLSRLFLMHCVSLTGYIWGARILWLYSDRKVTLVIPPNYFLFTIKKKTLKKKII